MLEINLRQPRFTHSACGPFIKRKERRKKLKNQEIRDFWSTQSR